MQNALLAKFTEKNKRTDVPEFRPGDAFHATRAQPGSQVIMTDATTIFTLQVRFSAGKVVWMKLT